MEDPFVIFARDDPASYLGITAKNTNDGSVFASHDQLRAFGSIRYSDLWD